jgi:MFS family permease
VNEPLILFFSGIVYEYILAVAYGSGYIVNFVDVMPAFSSIVFGITTAAATLGALLANVIAGLVIKKPVLEDWRKLFILFSIIYFIGGVVYILLGSAKPRKWATLAAQQTIENTLEAEESVPMQPTVEKTQDAREAVSLQTPKAIEPSVDAQMAFNTSNGTNSGDSGGKK